MPSGQQRRIEDIGGGVAVVWREAAGWQVEITVNFGPNMVIFGWSQGQDDGVS